MKRRDFISASNVVLGSLVLGRAAITGGSLLLAGRAQKVFADSKNTNLPLELISAFDDLQGQHFVGLYSPHDNKIQSIAVPARAHDSLVLAKNNQILFFARRPGLHTYIVDQATASLQHVIDSPAGRHFYGHGCLSADERYLFTTENDYGKGLGYIGIYDCADNFKRIDEMPSYGIGPHQLALMPDQKTIVVANGGIMTHPDQGRKKLNIADMKPSLTYIDISSRKKVAQVLPPHHQLSLRHLAVDSNGKVIVAAQFQGRGHGNGGAPSGLPLVFQDQGESQLSPLKATEKKWMQQNDYIASVAIADNGVIAATSPRGGLVNYWNADGEFISSTEIRDVAGVAFQQSGKCFWLSNGSGKIRQISSDTLKTLSNAGNVNFQWDNHLSILGA